MTIVGAATGFIAFLFVGVGMFLLWSTSLMIFGPGTTRFVIAVAGLMFVAWVASSIKNA